MTDIISTVQAGAKRIQAELSATIPDINFGVGSYR